MNVGFDAKRAFLNQSGLGNYSRTLIRSLAEYFPENTYSLFTPKNSNIDFSEFKNVKILQPEKFLDRKLSSRWRSYGITGILEKNQVDVYHGLSNELPFNISKFKGKKVVTIHDLIFLRYPKLYLLIDRRIYNKKFKSACELADIIIATSEQTKNDIIEFYSIDPEKIKVIYQSCDAGFRKEIGRKEIDQVRSKYKLPGQYLLNVGTIEARKNLLTIVKALAHMKDVHLVVVGKKKAPYFKKIRQTIEENKLSERVHFLENIPANDLPALYKEADIFIYPSLFEGFGIPILEALSTGTPVITTKGGCFEEVGGLNSIYIEPTNQEQLAAEIKRVLSNSDLQKNMIKKGLQHAQLFLPQRIAGELINLYSK